MPEKLHELAKCMNKTSHTVFNSALATDKKDSVNEKKAQTTGNKQQ